MLDAFWAAPPVTRTLTAICLIESVAVYARLLAYHRIVFAFPLIFKFPPEIWRLFTSFLISGPGLGIIFDPYFIWQYGCALEKESPRFTIPGEFLTYIVFVGSIILLTGNLLLGIMTFTQSLICAIAYTYAQDNRGKKIKFIVITMNVKWLPYAMIFLTFVLNGPESAMMQALGVPAAHLYDFLTRYWPDFGGGRNVIVTPAFVARWFGGNSTPVVVKKYGTVFRPPPSQPTSSFSSGWGTRGQGRRLGGE